MLMLSINRPVDNFKFDFVFFLWLTKKRKEFVTLTRIGSDKALKVCPLVVLVLVVHPRYKATPDIPKSAETALISETTRINAIVSD